MFPDPVKKLPPDSSMRDVDFIMSSDFSEDIKEVRAAKINVKEITHVH